MQNVNLEEAKIMHDGQWLTAEELAGRIQDKIDNNNLKFASLADSLEKLNTAIENSYKMEVKIVLPKEVYENLKAKGQGNDTECLKKAIMAFTGHHTNFLKTANTVNCFKCKAPVEITTGEKGGIAQCPECAMKDNHKKKNDEKIKYKDHFLG